MVKKNKMGIQAICSALESYVHSQKDINTKDPNATKRDRLEGLLVVDQRVLRSLTKTKLVLFFDTMTSLTNAFTVSNDMQKIIIEGVVADFFNDTEEESMEVPAKNVEEGADPSLVTPKLSDNTNEDVTRLRKEGYG